MSSKEEFRKETMPSAINESVPIVMNIGWRLNKVRDLVVENTAIIMLQVEKAIMEWRATLFSKIELGMNLTT
jgi:hypothetical protein